MYVHPFNMYTEVQSRKQEHNGKILVERLDTDMNKGSIIFKYVDAYVLTIFSALLNNDRKITDLEFLSS